jgi:hypothetical protein
MMLVIGQLLARLVRLWRRRDVAPVRAHHPAPDHFLNLDRDYLAHRLDDEIELHIAKVRAKSCNQGAQQHGDGRADNLGLLPAQERSDTVDQALGFRNCLCRQHVPISL